MCSEVSVTIVPPSSLYTGPVTATAAVLYTGECRSRGMWKVVVERAPLTSLASPVTITITITIIITITITNTIKTVSPAGVSPSTTN